MASRCLAALAAAGALLSPAAAAPGAEPGPFDGLPPLRYELPAAGSYELPVIDRVSDHSLLGPGGERVGFPALREGQCAVVAFVYTHCTDASGCPLSLASLQRLDRAVAGRADLAPRVRLVTVSFDPARDGPDEMAHLRHHMAPRGDWTFLTAEDGGALAPVLADYGQDAVPLMSGDGARTGLFRHVAKVFLVDDRGRVRSIYSTGTLDARVLLRDVETLLLH